MRRILSANYRFRLSFFFYFSNLWKLVYRFCVRASERAVLFLLPFVLCFGILLDWKIKKRCWGRRYTR